MAGEDEGNELEDQDHDDAGAEEPKEDL